MSLNINHPNEDISTSDGNAPTLGGGAPSVYVMSTSTATAAYYAKIVTLAFPATSNVSASLNFILTPKNANGSYSSTIASATILQGAAGLSTSSKIDIVYTDASSVNSDDLFIVSSSATNGTDVELYMQSIIAAAYDVQLLSSSFDAGVSISSWNNGAAWSATDPTISAAVSVTSANAGYGTYVPVVQGSTTAGIGTYTAQLGEYLDFGKFYFVRARIVWSAHTGTGNLQFTLPFTTAPESYPLSFWQQNISFTGPHLQMRALANNAYAELDEVSAGGIVSGVPMDTTGTIIFEGLVKK